MFLVPGGEAVENEAPAEGEASQKLDAVWDGLTPSVAIGSTILGHFHDMEQHGDFYSLALLVSTFQSLNLL